MAVNLYQLTIGIPKRREGGREEGNEGGSEGGSEGGRKGMREGRREEENHRCRVCGGYNSYGLSCCRSPPLALGTV